MNLKLDKSYLNDWKFYFKLFFGLFLLAAIIYHWINPIIYGITMPEKEKLLARNWEWYIQDKGDYTLNFLSYFTIQTNIMVALWFIGAAIFHKQEGKIDSKWFGQYMTLAITILITITGLVFNTMLLWTVLNQTGFYFWFTNVVEHMIAPIVMIVYFLFFMKREKKAVVETKLFWQEHLWKYFIYPIVWLIVMLIRGQFRYMAGKAYAYQYFFVNIHVNSYGLPGWVWLIIAAIFIISIISVLSTLFNYLNYKQQTKTIVRSNFS